MKKIAEKVALVALVCVTLVFVLTTLLYVTGVIAAENSNVVIILMSVLTAVYAGLSAYLLYVNFSERENLKEILLFSDTGSATHTSVKVVKNIVEGCARQVEGIEGRHVRIRADEKGGFVAIVSVKATAENVTPAIGKLRELLADSFARTLNLTFSSINFNVDRLNGKYVPNPKEGDQPTAPQEQTEQQQPSEEKQEDKPRKKHKDATAATTANEPEAATEQPAEVAEQPAETEEQPADLPASEAPASQAEDAAAPSDDQKKAEQEVAE